MRRMDTVLVFGTFDLLHKGHEYFLSSARRRGDRLVVVVGTDRNVVKFKGRLPVENQRERLAKVRALPSVEQAILGREDLDYIKMIDRIKPKIICLGYDQDSLGLEARLRGRGISIARLEPYKETEFKTSVLRLNMK
jgi:FAD synthetase